MKIFVGIDLGSTTSKAVVMGEGGAILGKGITNSRSNYDTAAAIAKSEAFIDARFTLFRQKLDSGQDLSLDTDRFLAVLERDFRMQQYLNQLEHLAGHARGVAALKRFQAVRGPLEDKLGAIFDRMREQAPTLFAEGASRRSDFFRDIAGSQYMRLAEALAEPDGVTYDLLVNIYDKCIIQVENGAEALDFASNIGKALEHSLIGFPHLSAPEREALVRTGGHVVETPLQEAGSVGTGYGRARLPFPKEQIRSEILCHGLGAHFLYPGTATVLDIGGQDTKAIQVDAAGIVTGFQMNDRCAAGCGRYLGYIADELNLGVQDLGPLAMAGDKTVRINSTCTVFAGAELRERLNNGERRENILKGLHRAMMIRAMSLLARSGGIEDEFTFTGGVANNPAAVAALKDLVLENFGERMINISPSSIYTGAIGAALFALRNHDGRGAP